MIIDDVWIYRATQKQQLSEERTEHLKEMNQCQLKLCEARSKIDSLQLSEDGARHEVKLITEERDRLLEAINKSRQETLESSEAMLNFMSQLTEIQVRIISWCTALKYVSNSQSKYPGIVQDLISDLL